THDPGDAYFADFAERVARRIAASAPRAEKRPAWGFGRLALAGSTVALLVTAGLAWMRFHDDDAARALRAAMPRPMSFMRGGGSAPRRERVPQQTGAERAQAPPAPTSAMTSPAKEEAQAQPEGSDASRRAEEVRPLANGEQAPVRPRATSGIADRL